MPKKHYPDLTKHYGSHVHSSSAKSSPTTNPSSSSSRSVNERLEQLRKEQTPRPSIEKYHEVSTVATQRTVPPNLRHILAMPETAPPRPKPGSRLQERRTTPGPAPPVSWLEGSRHAPSRTWRAVRRRKQVNTAEQSSSHGDELRHTVERFSALSRLLDAPAPLPAPGSLTHQLLKTLALNWEYLVEYEQYNLPALGVHIKSCLLSYLSVYAPASVITIDGLKILFYTDKELPGSTGAEELTQLDLSRFLNPGLTINDLTKYLPAPIAGNSRVEEAERAGFGVQSDIVVKGTKSVTKPSRGTQATSTEPAESWEDEAGLSDSKLPLPLKASRFPNLRRLSLARPGSYASWSQLLNLSQHLSTITHLSLAYWPIPSVTPNSNRAFVETRHANVSYGGSHLYSTLDEDWHEAANILRRLSKNTYSLRWLDLEGCNEWLSALTWEGTATGNDRWVDRTFRSRYSSSPDETSAVQGPDWNGCWSQVTYVNVAQGSLPHDVEGLRNLPAGVIAADLLLYLRSTDEDERPPHVEVTPAEIPQWLENEKQARKVAQRVKLKRMNAKGLFCKFDHGWSAQGMTGAKKKKKNDDEEEEGPQSPRVRRPMPWIPPNRRLPADSSPLSRNFPGRNDTLF